MPVSHRERMQACLASDSGLDHPPIALWRHFPVDDQAPTSLAAAVLALQRLYDFDLVKVTPASSFCLKDWGVEDVWEGDSEGTRRYTKSIIRKPRDWERLRTLSPSAAHLAAQLDCLRILRHELGREVPLLQTIFSPLAQAKNLAGGDLLLVHLRRYPEAVMKGLAAIAETTRRFVEACLATGIDGIFFAVQHAQASLLSLEEYRMFGLPYDRKALEPAGTLWCNLLHLHGDHVYFDLALQYGCPIVNWHDRETGPSLKEAQVLFQGAVCGGVSQKTIVFGSPSQVREEAAQAITQTGGRRFILGTGCVVPIIAPHGNLVAAKEAVTV